MRPELFAVVLEGNRERVFVEPPDGLLASLPKNEVEANFSGKIQANPRDLKVRLYGFDNFNQLFSNRQRLAIKTFSDILQELHKKLSQETEDEDYSVAIKTYLAIAINRGADRWSKFTTWDSTRAIRNTFGRQAIPMVWDFAEVNVFSNSTANWTSCVNWICKYLKNISLGGHTAITQKDAMMLDNKPGSTIYCTDPPYYDNIAYADISDFFYVIMKSNLQFEYPKLFSTILTLRKRS